MRGRQIACALACFASAFAVPAATALGAAPGRVAGTVRGLAVPSPESGAAVIQAVRLDSGVIAASQRLPSSGAYALTPAAGPYVLLTSLADPATGRQRTITSRALALRAGQRRSVPVRVRAAASAPAIEVGDFTGGRGKLAALNRGLPALLQSAMVTTTGACPARVLANARQRALLPTRAALRSSPFGDRRASLRRALVAADWVVTGTLTASGQDNVAYDLRIATDRGVVRDVVRGQLHLKPGFTTGAEDLGRELLQSVCALAANPTPPADPPVLAGTFSGQADYSSGQDHLPIVLRWSGTLDLVRGKPDATGAVEYTLRGGSASLSISGRTGACAIDGSGTIDLVETNPGGAPPVLTVDPGPSPSYRMIVQSATGELVARKSDCRSSADNGEKVVWPLIGVALAFTPDPIDSGSRSSFAASLSGRPAPPDPLHSWQWALAPPG